MRKVALFTHPDCLRHNPGLAHPESPDRLRAVLSALEHPDFTPLLREQAPLAPRELLMLAHPAEYVDEMLALDGLDRIYGLDPDTFVGAGSMVAARRAAGGAAAAVDAVMEGWADAAFAAIRPPGHHAETARAMGFCVFANAAIAARHAREKHGLTRIAIIDFDVHHGNGTQDIFWRDPDLLYVSSHQHPCYPGTGTRQERGAHRTMVNLPLAPGTGSEAFRRVWTDHGVPAIEAFGPELLILSAGFDAHLADPLAALRLETEDFGWITDQLLDVAARHARGRIVSLLEGGYDLGALGASAALHVRRLIG